MSASGDAASAIAEAARSAGFIPGHRVPWMLLAPLAAVTPPVAGLDLRRVDDAAGLRTFNDVCADAFGLDRAILAVLDDPRMLELPGFGFHLAFLQASPDGLPLYERMRFQHAMEMQTWSLA